MLTRRAFVVGCSALICSCGPTFSKDKQAISLLKKERARLGGRLGVHVLDTGTGRRLGLDDGSRFAMASTFKLLLAAAVLERCERGLLKLDQRVIYGAGDMVPHAPETTKNLERGFMTLEELCGAIVTVSDNPAANLLLSQIGGPAGLTHFARSLGDATTRLDRIEPALNENAPDDPRDTTTARAMVDTMHALLIGGSLSAGSRERLIAWLSASQTGRTRIRGGLPASWRAGDKTGTGANGAVNDLAIVWPPGRAPILIAIYMSSSTKSVDELSAGHRAIARIIAEDWA